MHASLFARCFRPWGLKNRDMLQVWLISLKLSSKIGDQFEGCFPCHGHRPSFFCSAHVLNLDTTWNHCKTLLLLKWAAHKKLLTCSICRIANRTFQIPHNWKACFLGTLVREAIQFSGACKFSNLRQTLCSSSHTSRILTVLRKAEAVTTPDCNWDPSMVCSVPTTPEQQRTCSKAFSVGTRNGILKIRKLFLTPRKLSAQCLSPKRQRWLPISNFPHQANASAESFADSISVSSFPGIRMIRNLAKVLCMKLQMLFHLSLPWPCPVGSMSESDKTGFMLLFFRQKSARHSANNGQLEIEMQLRRNKSVNENWLQKANAVRIKRTPAKCTVSGVSKKIPCSESQFSLPCQGRFSWARLMAQELHTLNPHMHSNWTFPLLTNHNGLFLDHCTFKSVEGADVVTFFVDANVNVRCSIDCSSSRHVYRCGNSSSESGTCRRKLNCFTSSFVCCRVLLLFNVE